jgi:hypothetical protein
MARIKIRSETMNGQSLNELIKRIEAVIEIYLNSGHEFLSLTLFESMYTAIVFFKISTEEKGEAHGN